MPLHLFLRQTVQRVLIAYDKTNFQRQLLVIFKLCTTVYKKSTIETKQ